MGAAAAARADARVVFERHLDGNVELFEAAVDGTDPRRLTLNESIDAHPSLSPDGTRVVFASDRAGNSDIWSMARDGTRFTPLTRDPALETFPALSPDGRVVAYAREQGLWTMSATGSGQRRIPLAFDLATHPSWSPDGTRLAFVGVRGASADVYVVAPDGSALQRVTVDAARESWPAWSPDGRRLAFASADDGPQQVSVALVSGSGRRQLTRAGGDHPTWTPDGERIVFQRPAGSGTALFSVRPNGTDERRLTQPGSVEAHPRAASVPAPPVLRAPGRLTRDGRWLRDPEGRAVVLHGVNVVHTQLPGSTARVAVGFDDDDVAFLAGRGMNVVRLGVRWEWIEPEPGVYDERYLAAVADLVDWIGARGIYVIIDSHQELYGRRYQGGGFPDWAAHDDGLPAQPTLGFPLNYFAMTALNRAFDHFWADDVGPRGVRPQAHYAAAWQRLATHVREFPHVAYDLLNEPWPGSEWPACVNPSGCPSFDAGPLTRFHRRIAASIRAVDARAPILYEPPPLFNAGADSAHGDIGDDNAVFGFHAYCEFGGFRTTSDCALANEITFGNAEAQARETGDALLLTEFSSIEDQEEPARLVALSDSHRIGWVWWTYTYHHHAPASETLLADPTLPPSGANLNQRWLDVLTRPYPRAVAGTPSTWEFDPVTRRFELSYVPSTGISELALPPATYPSPPNVTVEHGHLQDAPEGLARVAPDGSGEIVRVVVRP